MQTHKAIKHFGSTRKLAEALGITSQAVSQWGDTVPLLRQYQIERVTRGKLQADLTKVNLPAVSEQRA